MPDALEDILQALKGERDWDGLDFEEALEVLSQLALTEVVGDPG